MNQNLHVPVLLNETIALLDIQETDIVIDGTVGYGGHTTEILNYLSDKGLLIGIDQDKTAITHTTEIVKKYPNCHLHLSRFSQFPHLLKKEKKRGFDKLLLDLGMSSVHLDQSEKGFSFSKVESLDMRMGTQFAKHTAAEVLNTYTTEQLEQIFTTYGELRNCKKLVSVIEQIRRETPLRTTEDLVTCIKKGFYFRGSRKLFLRTCAQAFQAIRIEINDELNELDMCLSQVKQSMNPGGRLAIISFHSLEDKRVKTFGKLNKDWLKKVNNKVIQVSYKDGKKNTRARSAKLRVFRRDDHDL